MSIDSPLKVTDDFVFSRLKGVLAQIDRRGNVASGVRGGCQMRWVFADRVIQGIVADQLLRTGEPVEACSMKFEFCLHDMRHESGLCRAANRIASATRTRVRAEVADGGPTMVTTEYSVKLGYGVSSTSAEHLVLCITREYVTATERITRNHLDGASAKTENTSTRAVRSLDELDAALAEFLALINS